MASSMTFSSIASAVRAPTASVHSRTASRDVLSGGTNFRGSFARADIAPRRHRRRRLQRLAAPVRAADDGNFLDKLNPFKAMEKAQEKNALAKREQEANQVINDDMRKQLFGDGLGGRVLAGMVNNVAGALKEQMGAAAAASQETYDAAERAVRSDPKMRAALGDGIQCTPPMSQMSSSQNVNGVQTQSTTIVFIAQGSNGAQAQVQATGTGGGEQELRMDIKGVLANGNVIDVDGLGGGGGGGADGVFDVEATTIDVDDDGVIDV